MPLPKETPITLTFWLETWEELQYLIQVGLGHLAAKSCTSLSEEEAAASLNAALREQVGLKEQETF